MKERLLLINYTTSKEFFSYIYKHELQVLNSYKNLHVRIAKNFPNHMKNIELKRTWKQREKKKEKGKKEVLVSFFFFIYLLMSLRRTSPKPGLIEPTPHFLF